MCRLGRKCTFAASMNDSMVNCKTLISNLEETNFLEKEEFVELIAQHSEEDARFLFERARAVRERFFGKSVYLRGLIEISNYCANDCYYCGIRRGNASVERYRLTEEDILCCCEEGYQLGFRTFVMQGGEDAHFTDELLVRLIREIKNRYPDCAVTLSLGERTKERYQKYYDAGADRYLLRHETANAQHYAQLHPAWMVVYQEVAASDGRNRAVCSTPCHSVRERDGWHGRVDALHAGAFAPYDAGIVVAFHHCVGHHRQNRAGERASGWRQCGDAEPLAGICPEEIRFV